MADTVSGLVVFLVALPLCLGIALASNAPLFSGLIAGIVGGLVVGIISGSHTSVSGPAAGLTAIVAAQIEELGSFEAFLLAVAIAGVLQIGLGILKAGTLSAFFPSSVIKGLLAAIGVILILKQLPHLFGHDKDAEGEMSYLQPDGETTFSELTAVFGHPPELGAICVGLIGVAILILWGKLKLLRNSLLPGPLVVVLAGVALKLLFDDWGSQWAITGNHLVEIPVAGSPSELLQFLQFPDFSAIMNFQTFICGGTIAIVASLETLLNLQAVDKLDKYKRTSPASRELIAQGCGNIAAGLLGGLPVTSVIVRGSVNVNSGSRTKKAAVIHGIFLSISVLLLPEYLNLIPLSALAAILIVTGFKLASPALFAQMSSEGRYQFVPFIVTLIAIVRTDLLTGILIGLGVSILFILNSNLRRPIRRKIKTRLIGDVQHIELGSQVTFLNKAAISAMLNEAEHGSHLSIDGSDVDFIDPDISGLIRDFQSNVAPKRGIKVSLHGFKPKLNLPSTDDAYDDQHHGARADASPAQVLEMLLEGNRRFRSREQLQRHLEPHAETETPECPLALVVSCIESRVAPELILDAGVGDLVSVRTPAGILDDVSLAGIELTVARGNIKLIGILGHSNCDILKSYLQPASETNNAAEVHHHSVLADRLQSLTEDIEQSPSSDDSPPLSTLVSLMERNVRESVRLLETSSDAVEAAVAEGRLAVVGMLYDSVTRKVTLLDPSDQPKTG